MIVQHCYYHPFPSTWIGDEFCSTRDHIFICSCDPSVSDHWYSDINSTNFTTVGNVYASRVSGREML